MAKKKVLGIFAHGDDEVLFGWPYLQNEEYERHVLILSYAKSPAATDLYYESGIEVSFIARHKDWHKTRFGQERILEHCNLDINEIEPDFILTHNPWGEYGHDEHIALHRLLVDKYPPGFVRWADITAKATGWRMPDLDMSGKVEDFVSLDPNWFNQGKAIYQAAGSWTTNLCLTNPNKQYVVDGVTIRSNFPQPTGATKILWVCECYGWAWWGRAAAMIERMDNYSHRVMWAVTGRQVAEQCGDADIVVVCHPALLPYVPKDKKAILIAGSKRSFDECP